jgi:hypothetical protein
MSLDTNLIASPKFCLYESMGIEQRKKQRKKEIKKPRNKEAFSLCLLKSE